MYICRIISYLSVYACMIMIEYKIPHFLLYILYLINGVLSILTPDVPVYFQELWCLSYEVCWCMIGTWWNILWDHFGFRRMWLHRTNFFYQLPVRVKILNLVFFSYINKLYNVQKVIFFKILFMAINITCRNTIPLYKGNMY